MKVYNYTVLFEPLEEGGYNVIVPAVPEICTFGATLEEAREMAKDAIRCFLESALKTGEAIPKNVYVSGCFIPKHTCGEQFVSG